VVLGIFRRIENSTLSHASSCGTLNQNNYACSRSGGSIDACRRTRSLMRQNILKAFPDIILGVSNDLGTDVVEFVSPDQCLGTRADGKSLVS
jgi:hypothetical protein